jgi:hypothetical protein
VGQIEDGPMVFCSRMSSGDDESFPPRPNFIAIFRFTVASFRAFAAWARCSRLSSAAFHWTPPRVLFSLLLQRVLLDELDTLMPPRSEQVHYRSSIVHAPTTAPATAPTAARHHHPSLLLLLPLLLLLLIIIIILLLLLLLLLPVGIQMESNRLS